MGFDAGGELERQTAFSGTHDAPGHGLSDLQGGERVRLHVFQRQNDFFGIRFHFQHHDFELLALRDHFGGMLDFLAPGHIGDVNEPLDALRKHHKGPKRR